MKKVLVFMSVVAVLMFAACGGGSKSTDSGSKDATEKVETKKESSSSTKNFDAYVKLIEKATPLLGKVSKGDAAAIQEYTKIAEEMQKIVVDLQKELENNPELMKKFTEITQKYAAEAAKLYGQ